MRRAAHSSAASEWPVCVRRGTRGGPKWSRPPRCYIRPEDHDVQTEVPDRVGGNRWRISTTAGDHHPKHDTQPSLALFFAAPARHGWRRHPVAVPAVLLWIAPLQLVIHSLPGRKRSIAPVAVFYELVTFSWRFIIANFNVVSARSFKLRGRLLAASSAVWLMSG